MEYMLTFHILNLYVDKTQPRQFKFTFKAVIMMTNFTFHNMKLFQTDIYIYIFTGYSYIMLKLSRHI